MPAKSKAEIGELFRLEKQGKIPKVKAKQFVRETPNHGKNLPQHVKKTSTAKRKGK